ncbi:MAG TPA: hypothetical protein VGS06_43190 [Streptosporangiaceae bacterium]|nr:hypothetical protein [Streptosporangiaceae bacterium]
MTWKPRSGVGTTVPQRGYPVSVATLMPGSPDRIGQAIDRAFSESPDCPGIAQQGETGL